MVVAVHLETKYNQPKIVWLKADGAANLADWVLTNRIRIKRWRVYGTCIDQVTNGYVGVLIEQGGSWITIWQWDFPLATVAQPKVAITETWQECNFILEAGSTIETFGQATAETDIQFWVTIEYEDVV